MLWWVKEKLKVVLLSSAGLTFTFQAIGFHALSWTARVGFTINSVYIWLLCVRSGYQAGFSLFLLFDSVYYQVTQERTDIFQMPFIFLLCRVFFLRWIYGTFDLQRFREDNLATWEHPSSTRSNNAVGGEEHFGAYTFSSWIFKKRRVSCEAGCAKYNWFTFLGNDTARNTSIFRVEVRESEKLVHQCRPSLRKENFTWIVASTKFCCQNEVYLYLDSWRNIFQKNFGWIFSKIQYLLCAQNPDIWIHF